MNWSQYKGAWRAFRDYWNVYGGLHAIVESPYFAIAGLLMAITVVCSKFSPGPAYEITFSVLPNILGFTLGGYVVMFSFGDSHFLSLLAGIRPKETIKASPLVSYAARYMHFLVVQTVALSVAVVQKAVYENYSMLGMNTLQSVAFYISNLILYVLLYYALALILATVVGIFKTAKRFDKFVSRKKETHPLYYVVIKKKD